ncbi:MAG: PQQ-binding-like beta-propeller repeat protein [Planctomycetes bacterium]|nr:PQQ-binding-like beta-propeller repeat protein [Planctomycetota bacterium]
MPVARLAALALLFLSISLLAGEPSSATKPNCDWPYFLGPNRNGSANDKGLLREWPEGGPKVLWKAPIGIGWASISSVGDDALVAAMDGAGESIRCLDVKTGQQKWKHEYQLGAPTWAWGVGWDKGGTRATPTISDNAVWTCGILGEVCCLDRKTGAVLWRRGFLDGQKPKNPGDWKGYCNSPIIAGNRIFWGFTQGVEITANAWDAETGKDAWTYKEPGKKELRGGGGQGTVSTFGKDECFVFYCNKDLKAVRVSDGKEIYNQEFYGGRGCGVPMPLIVDNYVLAMPDLDFAYMVELDRTKEPFQGKIAWKVNHLAKRWGPDDPYVSLYHNWVHHEGYLYGFVWPELDMGNGFGNSPCYLICVELKTGKLMWSKDGYLQGTSLIVAEGMLYVRSFQTLQLVECNPKAFTLRGKVEKLHNLSNSTNPGQIDWTMPTIANGRLYLRLPAELICYDIKDPKASSASK